MSLPSFVKYILPLAFLGTTVAPPHQIQAQENTSNRGTTTFFCGTHKEEPATIADHGKRGEVAMIVWTSLDFEGSGWSPQKRCRAVSQRFQENQERGTLNYMIEGRLNGYPVICASREKPKNETQQCSDSNMLLVLHPRKDDPQKIIQNIYDISIERSSYSSYPFPQIPQSTPLVTSPDGTSRGIDIGDLLRIAPAVSAEDSAEDNCDLFCSQ